VWKLTRSQMLRMGPKSHFAFRPEELCQQLVPTR
jgi:hypothetical protein